MDAIKNVYIDEFQNIDIHSMKSRVLNHQFNLSTNTMVGFVNTHGHKSVTFIFEKKCTEELLLSLSKLFLTTIQLSFPNMFSLQKFELALDTHKLSKFYHYHGNKVASFATLLY